MYSNNKKSQVFFLFITLAITIFGAIYYTNQQVQNQIDLRYQAVNNQLHDEVKQLIEQTKKTLLLIAIAVSDQAELKRSLIENTPNILALNTLSDKFSKQSNVKDLWFQIINAKGDSFYRSWTKKRGDSLLKARLDVVNAIKNQKINTSISTGKFDLSFKVMVPIFLDQQFLGIFEVIGKFNTVADYLKKQGINPVFLIDKKYKKQLTKAVTKKFLNDYYVTNVNVLDEDLNYLKNHNLSSYINSEKSYFIDTNNNLFISYIKLPDVNNEPMGHFFLFKPLDSIAINDIVQSRDELLLSIGILFSFLLLILYMLSKRSLNNRILILNEELEETVLLKTKKLNHLAHHDPLTQLPNRTLFAKRLQKAITKSDSNKSKTALLFVDLDRFKDINDTLGHTAGDQVLFDTAIRLATLIKKTDTLSRFGGDEFVLVLSDIQSIAEAESMAENIINVLKPSMKHHDSEFYISPSIGISIYPDQAQNAEILLRNADSAMYKAKMVGRNNYQCYSKEMTEQALVRSTLESDLHQAINNNEFLVYYQPKYNCISQKIIGIEALVRWKKNGDIIMPSTFIPIAEETGQIIEIGNAVIKQSFKQLMLWKNLGLLIGKMSVNLSVKQIQRLDFIEDMKRHIAKYKIDPNDVQFEVTESYIMNNPDAAIKTLQQLKDLQFSIAIDDFGTGYSSLSYLKRLPVDELKIDQSFIKDIPKSKDDLAIIKSIISLAKGMNLQVIAEGIETIEQQETLIAENCERVQGFLYSCPVNKQEMTELLKNAK